MKSPSAIAQSCSHRHGAGTRPIRECDRMPLSPTISKSHVPSRFAGSSRAHESRSPLSRPSSDISVSTPDGPSNHVSCALPVGSVSCDHITLSCPSPARRGVSTIPEGDTNINAIIKMTSPFGRRLGRPQLLDCHFIYYVCINISERGIGHPEIIELAGVFFPANVDILNPRHLGTFPKPADQGFDLAFFPFGYDFDAAVVDVPHPALEAERRRPSAGMVAKEHSLNPSRNKRVSPCVHGRAKFSTSRPGRKEFGETLKDF